MHAVECNSRLPQTFSFGESPLLGRHAKKMYMALFERKRQPSTERAHSTDDESKIISAAQELCKQVIVQISFKSTIRRTRRSLITDCVDIGYLDAFCSHLDVNTSAQPWWKEIWPSKTYFIIPTVGLRLRPMTTHSHKGLPNRMRILNIDLYLHLIFVTCHMYGVC